MWEPQVFYKLIWNSTVSWALFGPCPFLSVFLFRPYFSFLVFESSRISGSVKHISRTRDLHHRSVDRLLLVGCFPASLAVIQYCKLNPVQLYRNDGREMEVLFPSSECITSVDKFVVTFAVPIIHRSNGDDWNPCLQFGSYSVVNGMTESVYFKQHALVRKVHN